MKKRVIINLPKGQSGLQVKMRDLRAGLGLNANTMPWPIMAGKMSEPNIQVNSTLSPVPRDEANLEAEKGEIAALPTKSGIPDTYKIGGKRHYQGGTPLNLPKDSFIYSDTPKMRIKDKVVLAQFGMPERKSGYTPAEIAKKYDIAPFKKILLDKNTDKLHKQTAELMIANYNLKLAKLALVQESMKGFPQGIPLVAMPYIESMEIDPAEFVQMNPGEGDASGQQEEAGSTMAYGGAEAQGRFGGYMAMGGDVDYFAPGGEKKIPWHIIDSTGTRIISKKLPGFAPEAWVKAIKPNVGLSMHDSEFIDDQKDVFLAYEEALSSGDPKLMEALATQLDKIDVPNSVGWLPWTQQDKMQDLSGILRERAATVKPVGYKTEAEYQAHLLDPYSPEKKQAELDWLKQRAATDFEMSMPLNEREKARLAFDANKRASPKFSMPGFVEDSETMVAFAKQYPDYFAAYDKALKENNPEKMNAIAAELYKKDTWDSKLSRILGVNEILPPSMKAVNKFGELAATLEERAKPKQKEQYSSFQPADEEASKKASEVLKYYQDKGKKMSKTSPEYLQNLAEMENVSKYTKAAKDMPSTFLGRQTSPNQWEMRKGAGPDLDSPSWTYKDYTPRMYSDDEIANINLWHDKMNKKNVVADSSYTSPAEVIKAQQELVKGNEDLGKKSETQGPDTTSTRFKKWKTKIIKDKK